MTFCHFITAHTCSLREGNVFSHLCLSVLCSQGGPSETIMYDAKDPPLTPHGDTLPHGPVQTCLLGTPHQIETRYIYWQVES